MFPKTFRKFSNRPRNVEEKMAKIRDKINIE